MIRLRTLGTLDLRGSDGRELRAVLSQPKRAALLAYLALATPRTSHRRDALLALFWPEQDAEHARNALSQAVHFLRRSLGADAIVNRNGDAVNVDWGTLWCDAAAFEDALETGRMADAVELYRGDLLAGFHIGDAPEFDRWLDLKREHLRRLAVDAALRLAQEENARSGKAHSARWARRALEISPYDESALRRLLCVLDEAGDRADAMQEYEAFGRRLRADLDLDPAPETTCVAETIRTRAGPRGDAFKEMDNISGRATGADLARSVSASGASSGVAAGWVGFRRSRLGWRLALGGLLAAVMGALVVASPRSPPSLDPNLLAVAPFDVLDPKLGLWREGLVDVLARSLDGAGSFRTVAPTVVIHRWQGRADGESARALGQRTGAAFVVFGQLLSAGPDSVRLTGAVVDARNGQTLAEVDRTGLATRIDYLLDSVSVDVIRTLMPMTSGTHIRLYSVGTRSLLALKAFLQGEQFFRRFALDSAIASYDRAVAIDTTFALALRRLQLTLGFSDSAGRVDYYARAAAFNHRLSPRDSLLVLSDSGSAGPWSVPSHPSFRAVNRRRFKLLEEAVRRYPEDPEVWYQIGEGQFHAGFVVGSTWDDARASFDRAIALDSGFAPAYIHPVQIALNDNDSEAALRYVESYLAISSVTPEREAMRLLRDLLDSHGLRPRDFGIEFETASPATMRRLAIAVALWPDANETQIRVWPRMLITAPPRLIAGDTGAHDWRGTFASMIPTLLIHRGHLREARRIVGNKFGMPFMELATLGAIPPETVEGALGQWLHHPSDEDVSLYPWFTAAPCSRTMDAALWWASRRDTARLLSLAAREESSTRSTARLPAGSATRRPVPGFVHATLALVRGDTALALTRFFAFPDSLCPNARQLGEVRLRLLIAAGRRAEAAAAFDRSHDREVPLVLERAHLAEQLGDRTTAVKYYQFVADAWQHGDPELQPVVAEAKAAIARLGGRIGR